MQILRILSPAEQVADHLSSQIMKGIWSDEIPGAPALCTQLGVDHRVVIAAFSILEKRGLLAQQGVGRRRKVVLPDNFAPPVLRINILPYEDNDRREHYIMDLMYRLHEMGHVAALASKSLCDMNMDINRVKRLVESADADAWILIAGPEDILRWFVDKSIPAFAMAGRWRGVPIAAVSPDKLPELKKAVRRLVDLGHRRIVMLSKEERRKPNPAPFEQAFLDELGVLGLPVGNYNLPDWKQTVEDFHRCIDSLFKFTPPTAILIHEMSLFVAVQQHLAQCGILAPRDVSLICLDPNPAFDWCDPSVAHIFWNPDPIVRRMTSWANNVARGKVDLRQSFTKAVFREGGTMGPAPV